MTLSQKKPFPGGDGELASASSLEPRFALSPNALYQIQAKAYKLERRIGHVWEFVGLEELEPRFLTDGKIAELQAAGDFFALSEKGPRSRGYLPLSPMAAGSEARERNGRKHAYVSACLDAPDGLSRSRKRLLPLIKACAAARGERPPGFSTVLSWIDRFLQFGPTYGTFAYTDRHDRKGWRGARLPLYQEDAIEEGIDAWLRLGSKAQAYALVCDTIRSGAEPELPTSLENHPARNPEKDSRRCPSLRTFERRCSQLDPRVRDAAHKGLGFVAQRYKTYQTLALPDLPYAEVEVDHCTLDIIIIDDDGLLFGRPDLVIFRDRATSMVAGYAIGFEAPSYASFLSGLRHALFKKNTSPFPKVKASWPCMGRIQNLFVDNALHFLGDSILEAATELGFNLNWLPPRKPWYKGALERFFRSFNDGLVGSLPGYTASDIMKRAEQDHTGLPSLTLREFEHLLVYWICDVYHVDKRKALGQIRGLGDQPLAVWAKKVARFVTPPLPSPDLFLSLAGEVDHRTIQKNGITIDYIVYESPDLWPLLGHTSHRSKGRGGATLYKVTRDPFDLGEIAVFDHFEKRVLRVPATLAHLSYATKLTLHQHNVIRANAKEACDGNIEMKDLQRAKAELARVAMTLRRHPGRRKIEKQVARFFETGSVRRLTSQIENDSEAPACKGFLELSSSHSTRSPMARTSDETIVTSVKPKIKAPSITDDDDDDLDSLRTAKNWSSYSDDASAS